MNDEESSVAERKNKGDNDYGKQGNTAAGKALVNGSNGKKAPPIVRMMSNN
ncbi:hypothetical protein V3595_08740 [Bacillus sp. CFBP9009]